MRALVIVAAFFGVWIGGYFLGIRHRSESRLRAVLFGLLCATCMVGFGYTLYHHVFLAGPLDSWTVRRILAYVITGFGVFSFGHLATVSWNGEHQRA
jgi:hypothetical protein